MLCDYLKCAAEMMAISSIGIEDVKFLCEIRNINFEQEKEEFLSYAEEFSAAYESMLSLNEGC